MAKATATKATATKATAAKATATATKFSQYTEIYNALSACKTKKDLVDTMNRFGLRTTTQPTTTPNINDLYIQFIDKSRLLITGKSLKLYTNEARVNDFTGLQFDIVNDGAFRNRRATVHKSVEMFTAIFEVFMSNPDNYLPTNA